MFNEGIKAGVVVINPKGGKPAPAKPAPASGGNEPRTTVNPSQPLFASRGRHVHDGAVKAMDQKK
jgi:hypothetical protein